MVAPVPDLLMPEPLAPLRLPSDVAPGPLSVLLERARSGEREDGARLALGIEGGGLAVSMSAGMALALERLGLSGLFDVVYGTSAGALVAAYAAAGRMDDAAAILPQTCTRDFVSFGRVLGGRPVVSLDHLMGLVRERPPVASAPGRPELRVLVVGVDDGQLRTLSAGAELAPTLAAVRASMAIPFFAGASVEHAGALVSDGGLVESIPVDTPLREGATHVLALRSRDASYRKGRRGRVYGFAEDRVVRRLPGRLPELVIARPGVYDREADALQRASTGEGPLASIAAQLAPPAGTALVGRLEINAAKVRAAVRVGARVVLDALTVRA